MNFHVQRSRIYLTCRDRIIPPLMIVLNFTNYFKSVKTHRCSILLVRLLRSLLTSMIFFILIYEIFFPTLNVSFVNPYMIGLAKLLLMANQWIPRNRPSLCWCGTSRRTVVKSPKRLNKWSGNQQIPNITTTMTNIFTTWKEIDDTLCYHE